MDNVWCDKANGGLDSCPDDGTQDCTECPYSMAPVTAQAEKD